MIDYIVFGIVDNGVMILGAFTGYEVEKFLPERFRLGALMPIVGAGIGNATSDFLGGLASLNMPLAIGSGLGCLIGLALIPLFNKKFNVNRRA
jgi:uncharacterized membrane protein YeaQ/YmgE (transglycosylase-associated protein family)